MIHKWTVLVILFFWSSAAESFKTKFDYLMVSDPVVLVLDNGERLKFVVTARATRRQDTLHLSVNGQIVDTGSATRNRRATVLRYENGDLKIKVRCVATNSRNSPGVDHICKLKNGRKTLAPLIVDKRIYGKQE